MGILYEKYDDQNSKRSVRYKPKATSAAGWTGVRIFAVCHVPPRLSLAA